MEETSETIGVSSPRKTNSPFLNRIARRQERLKILNEIQAYQDEIQNERDTQIEKFLAEQQMKADKEDQTNDATNMTADVRNEEDVRANFLPVTTPRAEPSDEKEVINLEDVPSPQVKVDDQISHLVRETVSADGGVIIDTTNIKEEDLDMADNQTDQKIEENNGTFIDSSLDYFRQIADGIQSYVQNVRQVQKTPTEDQEKPETSDVSGAGIPENDLEVEAEQTSEGTNDNFMDASLASLQHFADEIHFQIKKVQCGLASKEDIETMIGNFRNNLNETTKGMPKDFNDMVLALGEKMEKVTCGLYKPAGEDAELVDDAKETVWEDVGDHDVEPETLVDGVEETVKEDVVDHDVEPETLVDGVEETVKEDVVDCAVEPETTD